MWHVRCIRVLMVTVPKISSQTFPKVRVLAPHNYEVPDRRQYCTASAPVPEPCVAEVTSLDTAPGLGNEGEQTTGAKAVAGAAQGEAAARNTREAEGARQERMANGSALQSAALFNKLTPEEQRRLKMVQCEYDALMAAGTTGPSAITDEQWLLILREHTTRSARIGYYKYLFVRECRIRRQNLRAETRQRELAEARQAKSAASLEDTELIPGTPYFSTPLNIIFHRIYPRVFRLVDDYRVAYAMQFGQPIVLDMGYGGDMSAKEHSALHTELLYLIGMNRTMREPFHLHLCNVNYDDASLRVFEKVRHRGISGSSPGAAEDEDEEGSLDCLAPSALLGVGDRKLAWQDHYLMTTTEKCYTELFPRQELVYLTPHATQVMTTFDPEVVYVIGGLVDLGPQGPLSLAKAKKQGIRTMKLPLDYYVRWKLGTKSLGVNHVFGIMKDIKETGGNWKLALEKNVPLRKADAFDEGRDEGKPRRANAPLSSPEDLRKAHREYRPHDGLSPYRTSSDRRYGLFDEGYSAGYKHFKKPTKQS